MTSTYRLVVLFHLYFYYFVDILARNIVVQSNVESGRSTVYIIDFGLAEPCSDQREFAYEMKALESILSL